jgi:hypothetical protein
MRTIVRTHAGDGLGGEQVSDRLGAGRVVVHGGVVMGLCQHLLK